MPGKKHFKIKKSREDKSNFTVFPEETHSENTSRINEKISDGKHKSLKSGSGKTKSAKQVHIAFLPEKYEPLEEEEEEEEVSKKEHKYKRYRKNFGKALRYSWKCLMAGLQNLSAAYAGPLSAASTLVPLMQMPRT